MRGKAELPKTFKFWKGGLPMNLFEIISDFDGLYAFLGFLAYLVYKSKDKNNKKR